MSRPKRAAAPRLPARAERLCLECGRTLEADPLAYAHRRIEALLDVVQVRQAVPGETTEQHRARSAERYESQTIHAQVVLEHLLDEIDGFCVFCSPRVKRRSLLGICTCVLNLLRASDSPMTGQQICDAMPDVEVPKVFLALGSMREVECVGGYDAMIDARKQRWRARAAHG